MSNLNSLVLFFMLFICHQANALIAIPAFSQPVIDTTHTLTPLQIEQLNQVIDNYQTQQENGSQIAILFISTLKGESIEHYANRVFEQWKIGQKDKDNGILFLIDKNGRQVRIEVGYGLEGTLTDLVAKQIIDKYFIPAFKQDNYYQGINDALISVINCLTNIDVSSLSNSTSQALVDNISSYSSNNDPDKRNNRFLGDVIDLSMLTHLGLSLLVFSIITFLLPFAWLKKSLNRRFLTIGVLNSMYAGSLILLSDSPLDAVLRGAFLVFVVSILCSALFINLFSGHDRATNSSRDYRRRRKNNITHSFEHSRSTSRSRHDSSNHGGGGGGRSGGGGASGHW